jgi:hypothetical protein
MMMILLTVQLLIFLHTSVPHPSQSQSTLYDHQSTYLFRLIVLRVSGRLSCSGNVFFHRMKVKMFVRIIRRIIFFRDSRREGCLTPIKPGLTQTSRDKRELDPRNLLAERFADGTRPASRDKLR